MFRIQTKDLELKIEVVALESLCLHEKTIPSLENKLVLEFKNWTHLHHPVIVDENHIVLDGNHRTAAFMALGFKYIAVCKIDYFHETANLRYWFRLLGNVKNIQILGQVVEELGGQLQQVTDKESLKGTLSRNLLDCGIQTSNFYAAIRFPDTVVFDSVSAYDVLEQIQNKLVQRDIQFDYIPCQFVNEKQFCNELAEDQMVIWTPQITKEMVVDAVNQSKLFAPKTTRHLIPARPLNVEVPTYWLNESISLTAINARVKEHLESKGIRRFGPGQVIDGRYYEEELFVFFDK